MHDGGLEERLRGVLRGEGDALPMTITTAELERRLALRRRERIGRRSGFIAAALAVVALGAWAVTSGQRSQAPSVGSAATPAPSESSAPSLPVGCDPIDPGASDVPPELIIGIVPGDALAHGGRQVAAQWNGKTTGTPGTWDEPPVDTEPIWIDAGSQAIEIIADTCLIDARAEALLTGYTTLPDPAPTPITLEVAGGLGSRVVEVEAPPTGGWTVRIRATYPTTDGSEAWSETLFFIGILFDAPGLTGQPGFSDVIAEAGCLSYELTSGASASDACHSPFTAIEGREPMVVPSGEFLAFRLEDGWGIEEARTVAVDAELVARGDLAPEYSVDLQQNVGPTLTVPITLDPGSWIVRIALNATRNGDTFGAHYDIAVTVTP
jgi:hypothetical protein